MEQEYQKTRKIIPFIFLILIIFSSAVSAADYFFYTSYGSITKLQGGIGGYRCDTGNERQEIYPFVTTGGDDVTRTNDSQSRTVIGASMVLESSADVQTTSLRSFASTTSSTVYCSGITTGTFPTGGDGYASSMIYDTYTISSSTLAPGTEVHIAFQWKLKGQFSNSDYRAGSVFLDIDYLYPLSYTGPDIFSIQHTPVEGTSYDEGGLVNYAPTEPLKVGDTFILNSRLDVSSEDNWQLSESSGFATSSDFTATVVPVSLDPEVTITGSGGGPIPPLPELSTIILISIGLIGIMVMSGRYRGN